MGMAGHFAANCHFFNFICRAITCSLVSVLLLLSHGALLSVEPDWSEDVAIEPGGRANIYGLNHNAFAQTVYHGRLHALNYPVTVSGNPIFTNFLWNEIGRGTDLHELEVWLEDNEQVVKQLTAAVFATKAPSYFDFFSAQNFDIEAAKRGESKFKQLCARWPYFHNNSAPTLCDVLLPTPKRAKRYYITPPRNKTRDFDSVCNGYPQKKLSFTKTKSRTQNLVGPTWTREQRA